MFTKEKIKMTTITTLSNFLNNSEDFISNCIENEEITKITTDKGNVVLITEEQYNSFIDCMCRKNINK